MQDNEGNTIEAQFIEFNNVTSNLRSFYTEAYLGISPQDVPKYWLLFRATVPPLGWNTYFITETPGIGTFMLLFVPIIIIYWSTYYFLTVNKLVYWCFLDIDGKIIWANLQFFLTIKNHVLIIYFRRIHFCGRHSTKWYYRNRTRKLENVVLVTVRTAKKNNKF